MIKVYKRDKVKLKKTRRGIYLRDHEANKAKALAYYYNSLIPKKKLEKGISVYKMIMRDFYTKSHRLECYNQLIKEMKEQRMTIAA